MAGFGTLGISGEALSRWTAIGLVIGFLGVAVLVGDGLPAAAAPWFAYLALVISPILWAGGSVVSRRNPVGCAPPMTAALQLAITGVVRRSEGRRVWYEWVGKDRSGGVTIT